LEDSGNGPPPDWRWYVIAGGFDGSGDVRIEGKLFETQTVLPGSIEPSRNLSPMMVGKSLCRLWCERIVREARQKYSSRRSPRQIYDFP
jgi:hypothetical protein